MNWVKEEAMSFKIRLQQILFLLLQFFSIQFLNGKPVFPIFNASWGKRFVCGVVFLYILVLIFIVL